MPDLARSKQLLANGYLNKSALCSLGNPNWNSLPIKFEALSPKPISWWRMVLGLAGKALLFFKGGKKKT